MWYKYLFMVMVVGICTHPTLAKGTVLATVNGVEIDTERVKILQEQLARGGKKPTDFNLDSLKQEVVTREILAQEAKKLNLLPVQADCAYNLLHESNLIQALTVYLSQDMAITKIEIDNEYRVWTQQKGRFEYKLREIILSSESDSTETLNRLIKSGSDEFIKLAKASDGSGRDGVLGWQSLDNLSVDLIKILPTLNGRQVINYVFRGTTGWHLILLEDVREFYPPPIETIREDLISRIKNQKLLTKLNEMQRKSVVQWR